jgi:hypothetical protein
MSDGLKGVCKDDPLKVIMSASAAWRGRKQEAGGTYSVPESDLEDGPILLGQLRCYLGMTAAELQKIAKDRNSRYLREILDLWCVCSIQIPNESVDNGKENEPRRLEG